MLLVRKKWADKGKVLKLNAFLRGVAAMQFRAVTTAHKDSYDHLIENFKAVTSPAVCNEILYADFMASLLHDKVRLETCVLY